MLPLPYSLKLFLLGDVCDKLDVVEDEEGEDSDNVFFVGDAVLAIKLVSIELDLGCDETLLPVPGSFGRSECLLSLSPF